MEQKKYPFVIHDESVNSHGFSILTKGVRLDRFRNNPVMFYQHDETQDVIGKWENIRVVGTQILADAVFDMNDPIGAKVATKVENGFLNATSLGINPIPYVEPMAGDTIEHSEIIECSIVSIPSNANAVRIAQLTGKKKMKFNLFYNVKLSDTKTDSLQNRLISLLGLTPGTKDEDIYTAIEILKKEFDLAKEEHEQDAEELTALALKYNIIPPTLKKVQLMAFKQNFRETKADLRELIDAKIDGINQNKRHDIVREVILGNKHADTHKLKKDKSEWDVDDYRKHAPNELAANPELYKKLINLKYNK